MPPPDHENEAPVVPAPGTARRRRSWGRALLRMTLVAAIFVAGMTFGRLGLVEESEPSEFDRVWGAWDTLYEEYVDADRLNAKWLADGAIAGMADAVGDTGHTYFLTAAEVDADAAMMAEGDVVDWAMVPDTTIGLIQLALFSERAGVEVAMAVRAAGEAGATSLLLDLRGNPGGYLDEAVTVAGVFLAAGEPVMLERDRAGTEVVHVVPADSTPTDLPVTVLVDADTASSAEIVMGALQDAGRATVVGTVTAGTGTILTDFEWDDGSVLSIGTERWFTPNARSAWHVGLRPDVYVVQPDGAAAMTPDRLAAVGLASSGDAQLLRAIDSLTARLD
jgi:hypothetical protein